jgi:hypothetical protein
MNDDPNEAQLRLIADVVSLAKELGTEIWLRGGWAMDFYLGQVTRDHEDIDWFIWRADAPIFERELTSRGYTQSPGPRNEGQLDFSKDDQSLQFAFVARDELGRVVVAEGPWRGTAWPEGILEGGVGRIGSLECQIISVEAQIEIKEMMPKWDVERPVRPKHQQDVERLKAAIKLGGQNQSR